VSAYMRPSFALALGLFGLALPCQAAHERYRCGRSRRSPAHRGQHSELPRTRGGATCEVRAARFVGRLTGTQGRRDVGLKELVAFLAAAVVSTASFGAVVHGSVTATVTSVTGSQLPPHVKVGDPVFVSFSYDTASATPTLTTPTSVHGRSARPTREFLRVHRGPLRLASDRHVHEFRRIQPSAGGRQLCELVRVRQCARPRADVGAPGIGQASFGVRALSSAPTGLLASASLPDERRGSRRGRSNARGSITLTGIDAGAGGSQGSGAELYSITASFDPASLQLGPVPLAGARVSALAAVPGAAPILQGSGIAQGTWCCGTSTCRCRSCRRHRRPNRG